MFEKICIILVANLLFYFRTFRYTYVCDDVPTAKNPPKYKSRWHKRFLQFVGATRIEPKQDHAVTMLIHAFVCVMIYLAFGANQMSFIAALLFSFNPVNNQVSIWMSGHGYSCPSLFLLLALYLPILSPIFLYCTAWFTAGFVAPLALLGSKYPYILLCMPIIWLIRIKKVLEIVKDRHNTEAVTEDKHFSWRKIVVGIKTMGFYLSLSLIPFKLAFYHSFLQSMAGNKIMQKRAYKIDKFFWIGIFAIVFFIIHSLQGWDTISFGLWWFFVCITPFCNLFRYSQEIAERYAYQANVGLMIVLATLIVHYPVLIAVFLTMYIVRLWYYMQAYQDDYWLVEYSVCESPGSWYAWHIRGMKRWDFGSITEAITMWTMAHLISPKEFKILFNLAVALMVVRRKEEALKFLKLAEENIIPGQEKASLDLIEEFKQGKLPLLI